MKNIWTIFGKELTVFLRDKRTIFTTFVLPIFFYMIMFNVMGTIALKTKKDIANKTVKIGYSLSVPAEFLSYASQNGNKLSFVRIKPENKENALKERKIDLFIDFKNNAFVLYYNAAKRISREARKRTENILENFKKETVATILEKHGLSPDIISPFEIETENIASNKDMGLAFLGRIMPYLIILMLFTGALGFGLEVSTGEKEKGTIATLLVSQASRTEIVLGKLFYVIFIELLYVAVNIAGFLIASKSFASKITQEVGKAAVEAGKHADKVQQISFSFDINSIVLFSLLVIPIGLISAALIIAIGSYAKSMKEGQTLITPVILAIVFIAILTINAPLNIPSYYFYIPILNTAFAMQEILIGTIVVQHVVLALSTTLALAFALIGFSIYLFNRENIHFRV